MSMLVGEALVGEGNEVSHIDLLIGSKDGPVGTAFANALANQSAGHSNLLAVLAPNIAVQPATIMIPKVKITGATQAVQMFGPAQYAVAKAVADSVADGVIPAKDAEDLCIVCGVFIHWEATDDAKIYEYNYEATKQAIASAMSGSPSAEEVVAARETAEHPFAGVLAARTGAFNELLLNENSRAGAAVAASAGEFLFLSDCDGRETENTAPARHRLPRELL